MTPILTTQEMKQAEILCVQQGDSFLLLMERAGVGAANALRGWMQLEDQPCVVLAGKGNNGGDGFVCARRLWELGAQVTVILAQGFPTTSEARVNFGRLQNTGVIILPLEDGRVKEAVRQAKLLVDALFGTGFHGELPQPLIPLCGWYNQNHKALHAALDVPSGACLENGKVEGECLKADVTLTFAAAKKGHYLFPCRAYCGQVQTVDIGIPQEAISRTGCAAQLLTDEWVRESLPRRRRHSHKGDYGHLLLVAGSLPYTGAALLSLTTGLRSGAGLVTLASISHVTQAANLLRPEAMTLSLPATPQGGILGEEALPLLEEKLEGCSSLVIGPGLGNTPHIKALVEGLLRCARCPVVIDADGLNSLGPHPALLGEAQCPVILTPHPGEMARLAGVTVREIEANRWEIAREFAKTYGVILVLKGTYTVIAGPEGQILLNEMGNSGLAKGGSGDLLAGLTGGLAAQGATPFAAAGCGVFLHARAADLCAALHSEYAMTAMDVADCLGSAFLSL